MKTIVVPTDLSPKTDMALSVAVSLARIYRAEIILLHSVRYPALASVMNDALSDIALAVYDDLDQQALEALQKFATNPAYAGVTITPTLVKGEAGLIHDVTEHPADLIVMASRDASGLDQWLTDSSAEVIVRYAHCPVLVVKEPIPHFRPENIVCALDVDDRLKSLHRYPFQMGEQGLNQFLYVLTPTDSRDPVGIREWVNGFASLKGITEFELAIRMAKTVSDGIIDYANEVKADLIVLYTNGYKGIQHLVTGSVAERVLNRTHIPVLVMRA